MALRGTNGGGNPVAAFDVDVSNDVIGDLGSPLCSAIFCVFGLAAVALGQLICKANDGSAASLAHKSFSAISAYTAYCAAIRAGVKVTLTTSGTFRNGLQFHQSRAFRIKAVDIPSKWKDVAQQVATLLGEAIPHHVDGEASYAFSFHYKKPITDIGNRKAHSRAFFEF